MISTFDYCLAMQQPNDPSKFSYNTVLDSAKTPSSKRGFPFKLLQLLEDASLEGNEHIVSWLPHGKAFKVHKTTEFENKLIGRYFRQTKYRSFVRQLYHYRFARIDFGDDKGAYYHPDFQRHNKEKCLTVQRRSSEDQESGASSRLERYPPSLISMSALTPALDINDYKIALGTSAQMAAIDTNRIQNFGQLQQQFGKDDDKGNPIFPQKPSATQNTNSQLPNNPLFASQLAALQHQNSMEPNWLGVWMARNEQSNEPTDVDLEPRPINDQQGR
ncbi:unnamed protein product [Cylindrotheca closterium]|uniref:HSF-type DNA-binding domain-containing protein n=1 Tax=Cylindrotheca closterium TaxID=2856 RepID=A0AAD2CF58_9STRA|nr:unnamed protein product [Cylindrotheca closterium]